MPAHRKSGTVHRLQGTFRGDRHRLRPVSAEPIDAGTPPPSLSGAAELSAWHEVCVAAGDYLAQSDRIAAELLARLVAEHRANPAGMKPARLTIMANLMQRLGMTPSARNSLAPLVRPGAAGGDFDHF